MHKSTLAPRILRAAAAGLITVCAAAFIDGLALASSPHVRFGVVVGAPYWHYHPYPPPYYYGPYPPPYYYPPYPPVVVSPSPPVYVEKGQPSPAPPTQTAPPTPVWYYCPSEDGYYPYVRQCPSGWQTVPAQPPPPPAH